MNDCIFCERVAAGHAIAGNELAAALNDGYPVNPGHTLIVPRRHESDFFALTVAEQQAMFNLASEVKRVLTRRHTPDGFNLGLDIGRAAGQTVSHVHLHMIPRYQGDVPDPRGGVRWVVPARAAYWRQETSS